MRLVEKNLFASLCVLLWSSTTTSAWVLPRPGAPARAPLQGQPRHTTALEARVGDFFGSGGDEDDAAAAAREARESLERMWASSAAASETSQEQEQDEGLGGHQDQLLREVREALPELQGEGADGDSAMVSLATVFCHHGGCCVVARLPRICIEPTVKAASPKRSRCLKGRLWCWPRAWLRPTPSVIHLSGLLPNHLLVLLLETVSPSYFFFFFFSH